jgi:uncharacterized membrane protein YciS (DUF1049 family)
MNMSFQAYLSLYTYILIGGCFTLLVLALLSIWAWLMFKCAWVGFKLINRYFERKMRSGQITKKIKKVKVALVKALSFEDRKAPEKKKVEAT